MKIKLRQSKYKNLYFLILFLLILHFIIFRNLPFFWDGISKSYRANWIYENGLSNFIIPTDYGSGHPALWIWSLAFFWSLFGKTLIVSRLLLLIVNIGVFYQIIELFKNTTLKSVPVGIIGLIFMEPTLLAQTTSLNNDMLLLFFTLLSLNSIIKEKYNYLSIALLGLLFTNLRGIYLFLSFSIIYYLYVKFKLINLNKKGIYSFIIAFSVFFIYCCIHYAKLGWVIITPNNAYSDHRKVVGSSIKMAINFVVYFKNYLELGRFVIFLFLVPLVIKFFRQGLRKAQREVMLIFIPLTVLASVLFLGFVPFSNPISDRYLMICFILLILLLINLMYYYNIKRKSFFVIIIYIGFITGHFWIYKPTISQPWDCSLAYLNYYKIERQMEQYLNQNGISRDSIGTRIRLNQRPMSELSHITNSNLLFADFNMEANKYIMLSNIENYTKDDEFLEVSNNWELLKTYSQMGVFISLYKKP